LDAGLRILLSNPRADEVLGAVVVEALRVV
jgi:hypothetical protein